MTNSFITVIDALNELGKRVKHQSPTKAVAQCPAHDDRAPSLSITHTDGKTLLKCFAGCDIAALLATLNLTAGQLFDDSDDFQRPDSMIGYLLALTKITPPVSEQRKPPIGMPLYSSAEADTIEATVTPMPVEYIYTDTDGNPVGKKVRLTDPDGKKTFRQYRYDNGQWVPGLNGIDLPLYNAYLIEVAKAAGEPVWIVEGEKDAETLTLLDHIATTMPNGAGSWNQSHTAQLNGVTFVNIIADNDEPGLKHAASVIAQLEEADINHRLYLPATGKDITDHIDAGLTLDDLIDADKQLEAHRQEQWQKRLDKAKDDELLRQTARNEVKRDITERESANRYALPDHAPTLTEELAKPDEQITFIIDQLWPTGANISLTATYKAGKTSTINNIVKALADGTALFGQFDTHHTGRIGIWNYEVSANQIRRWIRDVGIRNTDTISLLNMRGHTWPMTSAYVIEHTIAWLAKNEIKTWIIDPLARAFVGSGDENSNQDVGIFLDTLDYIKDQAGVDNLLIAAHTGRNAEQGNQRARGASRFDDWVDARWMLTKDADGQRWFTADGRDVSMDESRLDWNEETREQEIAINIGREQTRQGTIDDHIVTLLKEYPDGLNKTKLMEACKERYGEAFGLSYGFGNSKCPLTRMVDNGVIFKDSNRVFHVQKYEINTIHD